MAADDSPAAKPQEIHRVRIGLNVLVQVAIVLVLALMVNYLGFEHYRRWDLTRDQKFALSDKTKRFLQSMKGKARITVLFLSNDPIASDVQGMLTEFQYAAKRKLDVENIDPERNPSRAKELFNKYKVVTGENLLIIDYDGRNKTVKASEMAEIDPGQPMFGDPPKVTGLQGRAGAHERLDGVGRRDKEHARLRGGAQGTVHRRSAAAQSDGAGDEDQPDPGDKNLHRE